MNKNIVVFGIACLVVLAAVSGKALAITCSDFIFTGTYDYASNPVFVHYENPSWTPPTVNLTLTGIGGVGELSLVSGNNPETDTNVNVYTWELSAPGSGAYTVNLTAEEGATNCTKPLDINVAPDVSDPVLNITLEDLISEVVNTPFTFDVTLDNTGSGSAENISVYLDLADANYVSPQVVVSLAASAQTIVTFNITPTVGCAQYTARVRADYYRSDGEPMASVLGEDDFYVGAPDLVVTDITVNSPVVAGASVDVNVTVTLSL